MATSPVRDSLEQDPELFYSRLSPDEARLVRSTVKGLEDFMQEKCNGPFLVAGCGGILRAEHPSLARDIDLAVVGFNYTLEGSHTFAHVVEFTRAVQGYFGMLLQKLKESGTEFSAFEIGGGSGPFARVNEGITTTLEGLALEVRTDLEKFGWYNSKGFQLKPEHTRPVDIQFVFNRTPEQWKRAQAQLTDDPTSRTKHVGRPFYYSVLAYSDKPVER